MNSETQLKVQAYLDNELTPGEARQIASLLTKDPDARDLYTELKETKEIVSKNEPVLQLPESRDFFWSKIQREINKQERIEQPAPVAWWTRLIAPITGAVALFAVLFSIVGPGTGNTPQTAQTKTRGEPEGPIHQGEVVSPEMSAITFRSNTEGVTVVWVSAKEPAIASDAFEWFE